MGAMSLQVAPVVRAKRLYEQIAEQIEALIESENLPAGARLPSERELAERLDVSRPSLREALIALETSGFIEFRHGRGNFVRDRAARVLLSRGRLTDLGPGPLEQFEARRAMETACAELAAQRATPRHLALLRGSLDRMTRTVAAGGNPSGEHREFHALLAEASGNSIFAAAVKDLWELRQQAMWDLLRRRVDNVESFRAGIRFREELMADLERRDAAGARAAMERHFARVSALYFD